MAKKKAKARPKPAKKIARVKRKISAKKKPAVRKPKRAQPMPGQPAAPARSKSLAPGYNWVNPFLLVRDIQAAMDFYQKVFGFKVRLTLPGPEGRIIHAELTHNDSAIMLGPENPDQGAFAPQGPSPVVLYTFVDNVDDTASKASSNGGKLVESPSDRFWGDRCCIIVDPQGHTWMVATHVKDVRPEDMRPPAS